MRRQPPSPPGLAESSVDQSHTSGPRARLIAFRETRCSESGTRLFTAPPPYRHFNSCLPAAVTTRQAKHFSGQQSGRNDCLWRCFKCSEHERNRTHLTTFIIADRPLEWHLARAIVLVSAGLGGPPPASSCRVDLFSLLSITPQTKVSLVGIDCCARNLSFGLVDVRRSANIERANTYKGQL
jgi:hypothetical protein